MFGFSDGASPICRSSEIVGCPGTILSKVSCAAWYVGQGLAVTSFDLGSSPPQPCRRGARGPAASRGDMRPVIGETLYHCGVTRLPVADSPTGRRLGKMSALVVGP